MKQDLAKGRLGFPMLAEHKIRAFCAGPGPPDMIVTMNLMHCFFTCQRQEIFASRSKRTEQLESILNDAKQRLDDHKAGRRLLEELEVLKLEKKIELFQRKLEQLLKVPDDLEIERLLNRERIRNERVEERRRRLEDPGSYRSEMEEEL